MIQVRVGKENEVDAGQLIDGQGGRDTAFGTDSAQTEIDADARLQDRISENVQAVEIDEDGGVPEPGGGDGIVAPLFRRRRAARGLAWQPEIGQAFADKL